MTDDSAPPARPEFDLLKADLRAFAGRQDSIAKAEAARRNASLVMEKAATMFEEGRISAHELAVLHATRLRLDPGGGW